MHPELFGLHHGQGDRFFSGRGLRLDGDDESPVLLAMAEVADLGVGQTNHLQIADIALGELAVVAQVDLPSGHRVSMTRRTGVRKRCAQHWLPRPLTWTFVRVMGCPGSWVKRRSRAASAVWIRVAQLSADGWMAGVEFGSERRGCRGLGQREDRIQRSGSRCRSLVRVVIRWSGPRGVCRPPTRCDRALGERLRVA
jgi:hypothetical protein